jgi:hypothetical protein
MDRGEIGLRVRHFQMGYADAWFKDVGGAQMLSCVRYFLLGNMSVLLCVGDGTRSI